MKNTALILLILFSTICFSQKKTDTIRYTYNQTEYKEKALSFVKKMIEANVKYGDRRKDLIYDTVDLDIVIHPVFNFKKSIKDDNGKTNLMQYIAFENNPDKQIFETYYKGKLIYTFYLPNDKLDEIAKDEKNMSILVGDLDLRLNYRNGFDPPDYGFLFKDNFSFYIENRYCVLIDGRLFLIEDIMIPEKYSKIQEFNYYFFPELNRLKGEAHGIKNGAYPDYIFTGPITPTVLEVNIK